MIQISAHASCRCSQPTLIGRNNILHGTVDNGVSTQFPQSIGMAASFDTAALNAAARVMADEQVRSAAVQYDTAYELLA